MTTRQELEFSVISTNKVLKSTVQNMDVIILLRNVHPTYRADFSSRLKDEKLITKDEATEFMRFAK